MLRTIWAGAIIFPATVICAFFSMVWSLFVPRGRGYHLWARIWSFIIIKTIGIRIKITGLENLDPEMNYVFVSNHASAIDIPVVIHAIPYQIRLVAKKELEKVPMMGWSLKVGDYILIDRTNRSKSKESLDEASYKLRNGRSVLMFAEGTRSTDGNLLPFKSGPFLLAIDAQVPVVPVTLNFTHKIMEKDRLRVHPGQVEVVISEPVYTEGKTEADRKELLEKTQAAVRSKLKLN